VLSVKVSDNGVPQLSALASVTVNLNDINEAPIIEDQTFSANVNSPNGTYVGTVVADDPDFNQTLSFNITDGNTSGIFGINSATGDIIVNDVNAWSILTSDQLILQVTVCDDGTPILSSEAAIYINIITTNNQPQIADQTFRIPENSPEGSLVGQVLAYDPDDDQQLSYNIISGNQENAFSIDNQGQLTVSNVTLLDYETNPVFILRIEVIDNGEPEMSNQANIFIVLEDVNEPPVMYAQTFSIEENPLNGAYVGKVEATDPDFNSIIRFRIFEGNIDDAFVIDKYTGELFVNNSIPLDYETNPVIVLRVEARDEHHSFTHADITIIVTDVNEAPWAPNFSFYAMSSATNGYIVGTVTGTDPDENQTLTYEFYMGNNDETFYIHPVTGIITIQNISNIHALGFPQYTLMVRISDNGNPSLEYICYVKIQFVTLYGEITTDIVQETGNSRFKVYPNPSTDGRFNIKFDQEQNGQTVMYLFDLTGQLIWETTGVRGFDFLIDTGGLSKGSYLLKTSNGYHNSEAKLIVQ
jgi:hypothetical protein